MNPARPTSNFILALALTTTLCLSPSAGGAEATAPKDFTSFELDSRASLIRVGVTPMNVTKEGREAAEKVWNAITKNDAKLAAEAIADFDKLIPVENLGGDYTALQWLCRDLIATVEGKKPRYDHIGTLFREYLAGDGYKNLKEYLQRKYGLGDFQPDDVELHKTRRRVLEDYVMFMNPEREQWESSASILRMLAIKPGQKIADVGCGLGYFTLKMAHLAGPTGLVYAIDTDESYTQRVMEFAAKEQLSNIKPVVSIPTDTKIPEKVDMAFIASLYHVIYGWSTEQARKAFVESIKKQLKPDGRLVIVDNLPNHGRELHSCFVDRRLVTSQFHHYGFDEDFYAEVSPLRYVLVLKLRQSGDKKILAPLGTGGKKAPDGTIMVHSTNSLVHIGSLDSYDITDGGIAAAKEVLKALQDKDRGAALDAIKMYERLIPNENFGGEFTALQWFCEHFVSPPARQREMLADPLVNAYFHYLADDDYDLIKEYVKNKYKLLKPGEKTKLLEDPEHPPQPKEAEPDEKETGKDGEALDKDAKGKMLPSPPGTNAGSKKAGSPSNGKAASSKDGKDDARSKAIRPGDEATNPAVGRTQRTFLEDFILFNNPKRPSWEKTDKIMSLMPIKPGDKVADIGCGSGYFTFRFSKMVGPTGKVFSMDIKQPHLDFVNEFKDAQGIKNVETILAANEDIGLKEQVDVAYMCSLYHIIYGVAPEDGRRELMASIKKALKPGGVFVVVDNGPVEDQTLPYHGPYLAKEIAINQIERYGFKFESYDQIIPQRYMLKFRHLSP